MEVNWFSVLAVVGIVIVVGYGMWSKWSEMRAHDKHMKNTLPCPMCDGTGRISKEGGTSNGSESKES